MHASMTCNICAIPLTMKYLLLKEKYNLKNRTCNKENKEKVLSLICTLNKTFVNKGTVDSTILEINYQYICTMSQITSE